MKTTIVNLYGGPGVGKSTSAAYLYYLMKSRGDNAELVREYVKSWAWEGRKFGAYDEIYFLGKQVRHESMLFGKVDYIVADAPVYMTAFYADMYCSKGLACGVKEAAAAFYQQAKEDGHTHYHVRLERDKPYAADGRYQTEEQALEMDRGIDEFLHEMGVAQIVCRSTEEDLKKVLHMISKNK